MIPISALGMHGSNTSGFFLLACVYHELLASVTLLVLTEPCEFLVHGCVVNFCNPGLDLAEITVKAAVKDYR
jgi:hypothetical protein